MSSPVWRTALSELGNRRTSPSSAQIATEVTGRTPNWVARSARQPGWRRDRMPSWRRSGSSSAVSRSIWRSSVCTAGQPGTIGRRRPRRGSRRWPSSRSRAPPGGTASRRAQVRKPSNAASQNVGPTIPAVKPGLATSRSLAARGQDDGGLSVSPMACIPRCSPSSERRSPARITASPAGTTTSPSRVIEVTRTPLGSPASRSLLPAASEPAVIFTSKRPVSGPRPPTRSALAISSRR